MEFKMSNRTYDILVWIARIVFPAFITLYGLIAKTCDWPYTNEALIIMGGVETFLGTVLGISTANYRATQDDETTTS